MSLTLHTDGGSRGNPGPAAGGVVITRDGEPVFEAGVHLGRMTNNQAEYHAMIVGLQVAALIDAGADLEVRCDSELLVKQVSGEYRVKNEELGVLVERIHQAMWAFESPPQFRHVRRQFNKRADEMANIAMDRRRTVVVTNALGLTNLPFESGEEQPGPTGRTEPASKPTPQAEPAARQGGDATKSEAPGKSTSRRGSRQRTTKPPESAMLFDADADAAQPQEPDEPSTALLTVRCTTPPIAGSCPTGVQDGQRWSLDHRCPVGFCVHAAAAVMPLASDMLSVELPVDEDPADLASVETMCVDRRCRARFAIEHVSRSG